MALIPLINNSKTRQNFVVSNITYYVDAGFEAIVDNVTGNIVSLYPVTQASNNVNLQAVAQDTKTGSKNIATSQYTIDSSKSYLICPYRLNRLAVSIVNITAIDVYLGDSSVSQNSGITLLGIPGNNMTIATQADIWAISSAGSALVNVLETY